MLLFQSQGSSSWVTFYSMSWPGKPYWRGRLSTFDLRVLTSLNQMVMKIWFSFVTKQATLVRRSTVLTFPPHLGFPCHGPLLVSLNIISNNNENNELSIWISFLEYSIMYLANKRLPKEIWSGHSNECELHLHILLCWNDSSYILVMLFNLSCK